MKEVVTNLLKPLLVAICFLPANQMFAQADGEKFNSSGVRPYLTKETVFIKKHVPYERLFPVSNGMVGLVEFNMQTYSENWEFYTIEGRHIFPLMWVQYDRFRPRFDSGACIAKNPENSNTVILYSDGRVKELPKTYVSITEFMDGVAMVQEYSNKSRSFFYINIMGKKIYPHLTETLTGYTSKVAIRPLECGMRAFYSNNAKLWGFLNERGEVVIAPQFLDVRDFANDYAMVIVKEGDYDGRMAVIDKTGKILCQVSDLSFSSMNSTRNISNVSANGLFTISDSYGNDTRYFSVNPHKEVFNIYSGMNFFNGYAFMLPEDSEDNHPIVVNEDFVRVGSWNFAYSDFGYKKPSFSKYGLATIDEKIVLDAEANHILEMPEGSDNYIGEFCEEGYAPFIGNYTLTKNGISFDTEISGYCRENGEIVLAFCKDIDYGSEYGNDPRIEYGRIGFWDPKIPPIPEPQPPVGPTTRQAATYEVKVVAQPSKAATVFGSGYYEFGDTIRVTGKPAEGWKLVSIECDKLIGSKTDIFNKFVVTDEMTITCSFVKDLEHQTPPTTSYLSKMEIPQYDGSTLEVPIWLEMSSNKDIKSPYGDYTYGYLAVAYDPDKIMHFGDDENETFLNSFMVPMLIKGVYADPETGKNYLMLQGGEYALGNIFVKDKRSDSKSVNSLNNLMVNLMLVFDRYKTIKITPAEYRVEIINGNIGDDSFEFGQLERLSSVQGWLPGGDKAFLKRSKGLFVTSQTAGLERNFLAGHIMKRSSDKPQIWWYPTDGFYGGLGDADMLAKVVEELGKNYHEYVSDIDYLKNLNFSDFLINLENNLLKCK